MGIMCIARKLLMVGATVFSLSAFSQEINPNEIIKSIPGVIRPPADSCSPKLSPSWIHRVDGMCVDINEEKIQQFLNELDTIRVFASQVALIESLNVNPCGNTCHFVPQTNFLEFKIEWGKSPNTNQKPMDTKYAYATMAHEYGHAVFEAAMKRHPLWAKYSKHNIEANVKTDEIQRQIRANEKNLPTMDNGSIDWNAVEKTHPLLKDAYEQARVYRRALNAMQAYSELFADALSVIYLRDPQVISKAVENKFADKRVQRIDQMRDFSKAITHHEKRQWILDLKNSDTVRDPALPYQLLGPARHELWEMIESKISSDSDQQSRLIKSVFDSISNNFENKFPTEGHFKNINYDELNKSLKNSFQNISNLEK